MGTVGMQSDLPVPSPGEPRSRATGTTRRKCAKPVEGLSWNSAGTLLPGGHAYHRRVLAARCGFGAVAVRAADARMRCCRTSIRVVRNANSRLDA
jgi:hypothetical protein